MLNNDSSHDEKWKNKKPSLDCFGLTQEVIDNNHIAHEQKANYDKKMAQLSSEANARICAIEKRSPGVVHIHSSFYNIYCNHHLSLRF